jgi:hypothetical protein
VSAWYRSAHQGSSHIIHAHGCPNIRGERQWGTVAGWKTDKVVSHIAGIPWLRLCESCANRLQLAGDHPARSTDGDDASGVAVSGR